MKLGSLWLKIYSRALKAEKNFSLLEKGDRILVGLSGGSDSLALLHLLSFQQKRTRRTLDLDIIPAHIPGTLAGRPLADIDQLSDICRNLGLKLLVGKNSLPESIFQDCFRCSQARRKSLFDLAEAAGCHKIALGHHADDLVETFLLNVFYSGRLAALHPNQPVLRGKLRIIRPLCYVWKEEITKFSQQRFGRPSGFRCPGSRNSQRLAVRSIIGRLSRKNPHLRGNLLEAIGNPKLDYLPVPGIRL